MAIGAESACACFVSCSLKDWMLSLAAGALGVLLAAWATRAIIAATGGFSLSLLRHSGVQVDGTVLEFTLLASIATGLLFSPSRPRRADLESGSPRERSKADFPAQASGGRGCAQRW